MFYYNIFITTMQNIYILYWFFISAKLLAKSCGQTAVAMTQLLYHPKNIINQNEFSYSSLIIKTNINLKTNNL